MDTVWLHRSNRHSSRSIRDCAEYCYLTLIFDADNTLWDTNAVFNAAQKVFVDELIGWDPNLDPDIGMQELHAADQTLIQKAGRAEYDFVWLWRVLVHRHLNKSQQQESHLCPVAGEERVIELFMKQLKAIPPLLPNVITTLQELQHPDFRGITVGVFSEGRTNRLSQVFQAHQSLVELIDFFVIGNKSVEQYEQLATELELKDQAKYMVGDSLKKDIYNAKKAGYQTIFIPSRYTAQNQNISIDADYVISNISEVPQVLRQELVMPAQ